MNGSVAYHITTVQSPEAVKVQKVYILYIHHNSNHLIALFETLPEILQFCPSLCQVPVHAQGSNWCANVNTAYVVWDSMNTWIFTQWTTKLDPRMQNTGAQCPNTRTSVWERASGPALTVMMSLGFTIGSPVLNSLQADSHGLQRKCTCVYGRSFPNAPRVRERSAAAQRR